MMNYTPIILGGCALLVSASSHATVHIKHGNVYTNENTWLIGAGLSFGQELYRGTENEWIPEVDIGYLGNDFSLTSSGLGYRFLGSDTSPINLSVKVNLSHSGYEADDSEFLKGMQEREATYDASLVSDFYTPWGVSSAYIAHDIMGRYKSYNLGLTQFFPIDMGKITFTPSMSLHYFSKKFTQYYFGIESNEENISRPRYSTDSEIAVDFSYYFSYEFSSKWQIINSTSWVLYGNEIKNSPIISNDHQFYSSLSAYYYF
ncbi:MULTISPECIES: MipA/OmpV family protein [Vibrio]|uniref:MipA/OmpV family protein n=1 Tax=Vibrio TaxID=662 RepID=UPI001267AAA2|nr:MULTISPECIES: MipA/OmpV family protein [Vibrio]MCM5510021.1 MipA/OmpV family protein [Vibrio sp. SCSIO 43169]NOI30442.1 MipA/OmpV family protein [Vibrio coralliilyticus]NOI50030.1 MipA/OmpV family protein [Vibrio coralliilyticus]WFB51182.1 MipA/OmpV family protein [Vibrio coralliilyticus]